MRCDPYSIIYGTYIFVACMINLVANNDSVFKIACIYSSCIYNILFLTSVVYLIYISERYVGNVWIGLYHEPYSSFKFVDQTSVPHTYWGARQPSRQLAQRSCTQANVTGSNFGVWDDVDCNTTNSFICEIYKGNSNILYILFLILLSCKD